MTRSLQPGDRIRTRSGRVGTVVESPSNFLMPHHRLVEFAPGQIQWVPLTAIEEVITA